MLINIIKIILLLFLLVITKSDGMWRQSDEKNTIESFLKGSGAYSNSSTPQEMENHSDAGVFNSTPLQTNPPHYLHNPNMVTTHDNVNLHQNMMASSSTSQFNIPQSFQFVGGPYSNTYTSNHLLPYSNFDSSQSGTVHNFTQNFISNQAMHYPLTPYNTNLLLPQHASSSFNNTGEMSSNQMIEDLHLLQEMCPYVLHIDVDQKRNSGQEKFREYEKTDITLIKIACNNETSLRLPINFGDYWHFMKERIYKNFKYHSFTRKKAPTAYYVCNKNCGGRLHYKQGFIIKETQKHMCIETEKYAFLASICIKPILTNRKSTSYNIFILYNRKEQFVGSQTIGEECNDYPIPSPEEGLEQVYFEVRWIENVKFGLDDKDEQTKATFFVEDVNEMKNKSLILNIYENEPKWELLTVEKFYEINEINKLPDQINEKSNFMGYFGRKNRQKEKERKKINPQKGKKYKKEGSKKRGWT